ncbi:PEP-CTERM-box response regulator transcription factor [Verrucomicrobiaceae bacterium SCGC AG-212-N21]|nr:PEP-CTERM-box response regulator transcription factor [Verrucomicrobiaceae bacterium SCGC AG-212-N21]
MNNKPELLIVDDDEAIRTQMKWALAGDYQVTIAGNRAEAVAAFRSSRPAATLLDLGLPPHSATPQEGLATLSELLSAQSDAKVIVISGQAEKENALQAVGAGAYDFLSKPVNIEELQLILRRCLYLAGLEREHRELQESLRMDSFEGMMGASPQMQGVFSAIRKVAKASAPVLILGPSGTGKELAASAIHRQSLRRDKPFVPINCNAIPENLLESELFGHEKGAFTGASTQRKGLIESAEGGTLFLDEIGELPLPVQVKLLRFLQEQRFQRVGGRQEIQADTRIVTATNADLKAGVAAGSFREDLYFRLAVIVIQLPALRERAGDVVLLANAFLRRFGMQNGKSGASFAADAIRAINRYGWPGNVRELQNRVQRAVIMAEGKRLGAEDLELNEASADVPAMTLKDARENLEREMLAGALRRHNGKIAGAAEELGISRPTFYELMEKLGISKP